MGVTLSIESISSLKIAATLSPQLYRPEGASALQWHSLHPFEEKRPMTAGSGP